MENPIVIIGYHGVVEKFLDPLLERNFLLLDTFKTQVCFLSQFHVLNLLELEQELLQPSWHGPIVVITVDDGHFSNTLMHSILSDVGLPWSSFISTAAVGHGNMIWTTELALLVLHGQAHTINILEQTWSLANRQERGASYQSIRYSMKKMTALDRSQTMMQIREQFPLDEVERLLDVFPSFETLSWQDIMELKNAGVEIGSHGVHHEIHHSDQPVEVREHELRASKKVIEKKLKIECRYFAFPNGNYMEKSAEEVRQTGYKLAFTVDHNVISSETSPFLLPRLSPNSFQKYFKK